MDIVWDTLEGGRVEAGAGVLDVQRGFSVNDIPARELSDPFVLLRALEKAMQTAGQFAPGTGGRALLTNMVVSPAKGTDQARGVATFTAPASDPGGGGGGTRWSVEDEGSLNNQNEEIDLLGDPIHTEYTPPPEAAGAGGAFIRTSGTAPSQVYPVHLNFRRPQRVLAVNGYMIGRPSAAAKDCEGCVNARDWPSGSLFEDDPPKRKGAWLCESVTARIERPGLIPQIRTRQLYQVSARFVTRGKLMSTDGLPIQSDRDWGAWGVHHNILGRIPADMVTKEQVAKVRALMAAPYKVGQDRSVNGYVKVCNYPIVDFQRAFSF